MVAKDVEYKRRKAEDEAEAAPQAVAGEQGGPEAEAEAAAAAAEVAAEEKWAGAETVAAGAAAAAAAVRPPHFVRLGF